jgi:exonuclease III
LANRLNGIEIVADARGWPRPSDHVPVIATINGSLT